LELRAAVTGCAGFIGSNLVDELLRRGTEVVGLDNFSSGSMSNIAKAKEDEDFTLIEGDVMSEEDLGEMMADVDIVYHLAGYPDVRASITDAKTHFDWNVVGTYNVLETMRQKKVKSISFASSSTIYGEAKTVPTSEDYAPKMPISLHGASKLAGEALITSYCHIFDFKARIFRFANIVGRRSGHGVLHDFIAKLEKDQEKLEILGVPPGAIDSYCHVHDCIDAILSAEKSCSEHVGIYNIGSADALDVKSIADIVTEEMELRHVKYEWTGGVDGGRGWIGDIKRMHLSIQKIVSEGWKPEMNSAEAVRMAVKELLAEKRGKS
jgi:UDP-glucose 4-epimerase